MTAPFVRFLRVLVVTTVGVCCASCHTAQPTIVTKFVERRIEIPKSLLTCASEPTSGSVWIKQSDVALFVNRLAAAGADCRIRLAAVPKLVEASKQIAPAALH